MASPLKLEVLIGAVDKITKPIADINRKIAGMTAPVRKLQLSLGALQREMGFERLIGSAGEVTGSIGRVAGEAGKLTAKLTAAAGVAGYGFKRGFLDVAATFETYQMQLESLEGSSEKARKSMDWVKQFAKSTPLELDQVMGAFVKMRTFGLDPMDGSMQALVDQNAKMGGSGAELEGIVLAVGQAWTKQKLQGEEALQLIERGVPVWDLLARRTGINAAKLQDLSSKGQLGRKAIKMLIEEIGKSSAGAAEKQAKSWTGMVSQISDYWTDFAMRVMDNGLFAWMKSELQLFLATLDELAINGTLDDIARTWGENLKEAFNTTKDALKEFKDIASDVGDKLKWLHDLTGSWKPVLIGLAAIMAGPLLLAIGMAIKSFVRLGVAMMATPIGWIALAVAALVGLAYVIVKNWEPIKAFFSGLWDGIKAAFSASVDWIVSKIEWLSDKIAAVRKAIAGVGDAAYGFFSGTEARAGGLAPGSGNLRVGTESECGAVRAPGSLEGVESFVAGTAAGRPGPMTQAEPMLGSPGRDLHREVRGVSQHGEDKVRNSINPLGPKVQTITAAQAQARAEVGGEIKIRIDAEGRPRVQQVQAAQNSPALTVDTGMAMAW